VYVDGKCPRCGGTWLYARPFGHACRQCVREREAKPERVEQRREYERARTEKRRALRAERECA
jgi:hypothetical protein